MTGENGAVSHALTFDRAGRSAVHAEAFRDYVVSVIKATGARRVVDLGGGANPLLPSAVVADHELEYVVADTSELELDRCERADLTKVVVDVQAIDRSAVANVDLCFSRMLLEHLPDPVGALRSSRRVLRRGGYSIHLYPTLYAVPFVVNKLLPIDMTRAILARLQPHRVEAGSRSGAFPAYYRSCLGPVTRQLRTMISAGYEVEDFVGYYGHAYYERVAPLRAAAERWWRLCSDHGWALHTSYARATLVAA